MDPDHPDPSADPTRRYTRPDTSTSAALARYASDLTQRMVNLATPSELARQLRQNLAMIILLGLLIGSAVLVAWAWNRDTLPRAIVISVGPVGGQYDRVGRELEENLQAILDASSPGHTVETVNSDSSGSIDNYDRLMYGDAQLAIIQADALTTLRERFPEREVQVQAVAPLYREEVMVIVRLDDDGQPVVSSIHEFAGRRVAIGRAGSGTRATAERLLRTHYGIDPDGLVGSDQSFDVLARDDRYVAAVLVSGRRNPTLNEVLATGRFDLLPIDLATAIADHEKYLTEVTIPRGGVARQQYVVPRAPTTTVATTAVLMVCAANSRMTAAEREWLARVKGFDEARIDRIAAHRGRNQSQLVDRTLAALYADETNLRNPIIPAEQAQEWTDIPKHPGVRAYFEPFESIGFFASLMESLVGVKELIIGFILIIWAGRFTWKWLKSRKTARILELQQRQLDTFMQQTVDLERQVSNTEDRVELKLLLGRANQLKFTALDSLTHEELRSDQRFLIFIMQCAQLIEHIRARLAGIGISRRPLADAHGAETGGASGSHDAHALPPGSTDDHGVELPATPGDDSGADATANGWHVAAEVLLARMMTGGPGPGGAGPARREPRARLRRRALRRY